MFINTDLVWKDSERLGHPAGCEQQGGQNMEITEYVFREEV